ncbi:MAG: glutathione S-transferase [Roseiarcus sp.]|jgi:glutathione S-transferase
MKLYNSNFAPNPRRVRIFVAEKGLTLPMVDVDLGRLEQKAEAFSALNPFQAVPALELDDGTVIAESVAICRYIEDLHPDPPLFGVGALERAMVEMWQRRLELSLFFPIAQAFRHSHPAMKAMETPQIKEWAEANKPRALAAMTRVDEALGDRPFIAGERFSIADITGLVALDFARSARIAIPEELARLRRWREALAARPSAKA